MTLTQRYRLTHRILWFCLALSMLVGLVLLWGWAYSLGEAPIPPTVPDWLASPFFVALVFAPFILCFFLPYSAEKDAKKLAAIAGAPNTLRPVAPAYSAGAQAESLPVALSWWHETNTQRWVSLYPALLYFLMFAVNPNYNNGSDLSFGISLGVIVAFFTVLLIVAVVTIRNHQKVDAVIADEQCIRMVRLGVEGPPLAWSDIRLLMVDNTNPTGPRYYVYDSQGRVVWWRWKALYAKGAARPTPDQLAMEARALPLIWLARTKTGLEWLTDQSGLMQPDDKRAANLRSLTSAWSLPAALRLGAALPVALLALAILPFQSAALLWLNSAAPGSLALLAFLLVAHALGSLATRQRRALAGTTSDATTSSRSPWSLLEALLALVGGGLSLALFILNFAQIPNDSSLFLAVLAVGGGAPILAITGVVALYRALRNR